MARKSQQASVPQTTTDLTDLIRARAYELYVQRGMEDGHDLEDWLAAEAELRGSNVQKAAA